MFSEFCLKSRADKEVTPNISRKTEHTKSSIFLILSLSKPFHLFSVIFMLLLHFFPSFSHSLINLRALFQMELITNHETW